ncbi:YhcN/YlaJ family sporulation lipoprotein, partial [Microbacteriaceae bacterium K1510]|nr:YhcN/YlaJ family sporulation lipoprotein [Microbacteriaceae bacterium K1510]
LKEDPQGAAAVVTANPAVVQRLREMSEDIRNGRPIAGFAEELADIVGRIIPQTPRNVEKRERPDSQQNQQRINRSSDARPQGNQKIPATK